MGVRFSHYELQPNCCELVLTVCAYNMWHYVHTKIQRFVNRYDKGTGENSGSSNLDRSIAIESRGTSDCENMLFAFSKESF